MAKENETNSTSGAFFNNETLLNTSKQMRNILHKLLSVYPVDHNISSPQRGAFDKVSRSGRKSFSVLAWILWKFSVFQPREKFLTKKENDFFNWRCKPLDPLYYQISSFPIHGEMWIHEDENKPFAIYRLRRFGTHVDFIVWTPTNDFDWYQERDKRRNNPWT